MINQRNIKTYSIKKRKSKVDIREFAKTPLRAGSFLRFYRSLPNILKAKEIHATVDAVIQARKKKRSVIFMCGAHVIKCGLSPVVIELIKKKVITCIVFNGAGVIHDFEIAFQGKTSEDVGESLTSGTFGMGRETADFINTAVSEGVAKGSGFGYSVAEKMRAAGLPYEKLSILYNAVQYKVPVCVCVAIGTDIIHQHPSFDAAASGKGSHRDFQQLVVCIAGLNNGGVVLNFGSAVIIPEVFLKALNLARNLGAPVKNFVTANFDMIHHYRPQQNIVSRPVMAGGKGYYIIGHHEIMLPLFSQAVIEQI